MIFTITEKTAAGFPVNLDEALHLLTEADLLAAGKLAEAIRRKRPPHARVTFLVDRNVNYPNVCNSPCRYCAFYR